MPPSPTCGKQAPQGLHMGTSRGRTLRPGPIWLWAPVAQGVESTGHHSVRRHNEPLILGGIMCSALTRLHRPSFSKHMYWACSGKMKHLHSFIIVFFWVLHEADSENRIAVSIVNLGGW